MFGKVKLTCGLAVAGLLIACGPAASVNANEGGACSAQNNDCGGDLSCQPVQGRQGMFCCPTPEESSTQPNCKPVSGS